MREFTYKSDALIYNTSKSYYNFDDYTFLSFWKKS